MEERLDFPIYKKIALDVATRIYNGEFKEGDKIHGRSTLAAEYNVSPETVRRAMNLLYDMDVILINQGSGIYIKSRKNAFSFIEKNGSQESVGTLKVEAKKLMLQKHDIDVRINEIFKKIIDYSDRLRNVNSITPIEVTIPSGSHLIGKTVTDAKFWQHTGGTIIGIKRKGVLFLSPGPYADFEEDDSILVIGDLDVSERINKYIQE